MGHWVDDIRIFNNIFYRNAELGGVSGFPNGVRFSRTYDNIINVTIYNNLYQGDAPFIVNPGDGEYQEFDNIEADPRFVATDTDDPANNDFHLLLGSLAIDAGTAQDAPSHDFENNLRPQGGGYDIGAYESSFSIRATDLRIVAADDTSSLTGAGHSLHRRLQASAGRGSRPYLHDGRRFLP